MHARAGEMRLAARRSLGLISARGAALLLSIYMAALTLLLLGGLSFQRITTDVKAAELSRDMQQAFYLAEGGLDQALQADSIESTGEGTAPSGAYAYTAGPTQINVLDPQTMRTMYTITATGTAAHRDAIVSGVIVKQEPLQGAFAQRHVSGGGGGCSGFGVAGSLHSGGGSPLNTVISADNYNKVWGDLSVGRPTDPSYKDVWGLFEGTDPTNLFWGDDPGVALRAPLNALSPVGFAESVEKLGSAEAARDYIRKQIVTGNISTIALAQIPPTPSPYANLIWNGGFPVGPVDIAKRLVMTNPGARKDIYDGDPMWDGTPAGDGKISMRVSTLQLWKDTQLVFHAPTTVYVEKSETIIPESIGYVAATVQLVKPTNIAVYAGENTVLTALDAGGKSIKGGVELIVAKRTDMQTPGGVLVTEPVAFIASVWAPESPVAMSGKENMVGGGYYDPVNDRFYTLGVEDPRISGTPMLPGTCWGDYCPGLPGEVGGTQSRYVVSNDLYLAGVVAIGKAGNQPPVNEDDADDDPTLSMWKLGPLD